MRSNYTFYPSAHFAGDAEPKFHIIKRPEYEVQTYTFAEFDEKLKAHQTPAPLYESAIEYAKKAITFDSHNCSVLVNIPRKELEAHGLAILEALNKLGFPWLTFDPWSRKDEGYIEVGLHSASASSGESESYPTISVIWSPAEEA